MSEDRMELHLLSVPGQPGLRDVVSASRPILARAATPLVAYLPAASIGRTFAELTAEAFAGMAEVVSMDAEADSGAQIVAVLERAALVYIPGGNTFLLAERLRRAGLHALLRERILGGLPLVGFSAGAICCGPNILTSDDMNVCACTDFDGLGLTRYNFCAHYPDDNPARRTTFESKVASYQLFHANPVVALVDGAYLQISHDRARLVQGVIWLFEQGQPPVRVEAGSATAHGVGLSGERGYD